ncbi:MAG: TetR/AcrR family transcriptional regulator; helix-turn-helix transcriptional regulator [Planctomycetes bacterium]|nr:TetR/AcrR family transcriptional regulator; helix-turn-helix transcriptional regulator [Planctomycetota bacterium]
MRCFARRGFAGTTTRMLARAAGVSEALVFRHFPDKRSLYDEIVERKVGEEDDGLFPEEAAARGDDRAVLASIAAALVRRVESDADFMKLLTFSCLEGTSLSRRYFQARDRTAIEFLSTYLARRIREGALRPVRPETAARAFLGMSLHHLHLKHVLGLPVRRRPARELVETWVDIFLGGMKR